MNYERNYFENGMTTEVQENANKYVVITPKMVIAFLLVIILMITSLACLNLQKAKLEEKNAYVLSVLINSQEDHLLLKYGLFPKDVGLEKLRDAWIDNPCYETATEYSEALDRVINAIEEEKAPNVQLFVMGEIFV